MASVRALTASGAYDIALFDTSSTLDEQVVALLQTVGNLIMPIRSDDFSFDQIGVVLQLVTRGYDEHVIDASEPIRIAMERSHPIFAQSNSWARQKRNELIAAFEQIDRKSV